MAEAAAFARTTYPSECDVKMALDTLRPVGLFSKAYDQFQLKKVEREDAIRNTHIITQGEDSVAESWKIQKPKNLDLSQRTSYFNSTTMHLPSRTYDRINHVVGGYSQKLHRDDREHAKSRGLKVNSEENNVKVPLLSNSIYGHPSRKPLEFSDRSHVRVELCKKDFLRLGGTNIGENPDLH